MNELKSKGFTLVELIIVMVLLGILAAVAVPRMSQSIMAGEEAAEQKFLANMISAIEVRANDEFVRNSRKQYTVDPFDALDKYPSRDSNGEGWWTENRSDGNDCCDSRGREYQRSTIEIRHRRNDGSEYTWNYQTVGPRYRRNNNEEYIEQGEYSIFGPGFNGLTY